MPERSSPADPLLSANIYAGGLLDEALRCALVPFHERAAATGGDRYALWFARYSRRGEHLKLRLHAEPARRAALADLLRERVGAWLATLPAQAAQPRVIRDDVPAIDPEDEAADPAPDRSLLWTTYRRSYVSLGGSPWIEDDRFVALFCACLSAASELALRAVAEGRLAGPGARQKVLLKALLSGVAALELGGLARSAEYLQHHRDVLLRFLAEGSAKERKLLLRFDDQAQRTPTLVRLGALAHDAWTAGAQAADHGRWPAAVRALGAYTRAFDGRPEYQTHRFTSNVSFSPAFKAFHGLANQLGLTWAEEAFTHHLLRAAVAARPESRVA